MKSKYADLRTNIDLAKIKEAAKSIKNGELVLFCTYRSLGHSSCRDTKWWREHKMKHQKTGIPVLFAP